ncbi:hypothetical protein RHGRI_029243 [Rhododendron griersonianum]|uniref:Uncharacterized protein n=1 Tax=Rhododendron griersonianum TaxID=479676 RepID=A0AAV6IJD9_9ERIC|nr:hypothetical protein RHGRI_029243 [Rhododendron griersonianum]
MEKLLKPYDREYMKMAMLKHEETFKHQVYELHRLYRIQKILMKSMENRRTNGSMNRERYWDSNHHNNNICRNPRPGIDLEQPAEEYIAECDENGELEVEDESEIKLTLGTSSYGRRKKGQTTPGSSVSGTSFSSSCSAGEEELLKGDKWTRNSSFGVEEELRIGRLEHHPWLFQTLSLNMT